jgi:glucokinase
MVKDCSIGVDLGGTNLRVALVSRAGEVLERTETPSCPDAGGDVVENLAAAIGWLFSDRVAGIGLAVPGLVDAQSGGIVTSPNIRAVEGVNLVDIFSRRFGVPVSLGNDASLAALGESVAGAGRDFNSFVLLTLGTGVGGGVVIDRKLLQAATELGHITVEAAGRRCLCGNSGCLEAYAGAAAIVAQAREVVSSGASTRMKNHDGNLTPEDVYRYAVDGDAAAAGVIITAGKYLGAGIASFINVFSPDAIILTGGLTGAWDILVEEAVREASRRAFPQLFQRCKIVPSALAGNAGIIGASALAFS